MKLQFPEKRPKHDSRTYFFLTLGLLTKDETAETTVRNLFSPFFAFGVHCRTNPAYFCANTFSTPKFNAETKN